jgi:hypothetical protein
VCPDKLPFPSWWRMSDITDIISRNEEQDGNDRDARDEARRGDELEEVRFLFEDGEWQCPYSSATRANKANRCGATLDTIYQLLFAGILNLVESSPACPATGIRERD